MEERLPARTSWPSWKSTDVMMPSTCERTGDALHRRDDAVRLDHVRNASLGEPARRTRSRPDAARAPASWRRRGQAQRTEQRQQTGNDARRWRSRNPVIGDESTFGYTAENGAARLGARSGRLDGQKARVVRQIAHGSMRPSGAMRSDSVISTLIFRAAPAFPVPSWSDARFPVSRTHERIFCRPFGRQILRRFITPQDDKATFGATAFPMGYGFFFLSIAAFLASAALSIFAFFASAVLSIFDFVAPLVLHAVLVDLAGEACRSVSSSWSSPPYPSSGPLGRPPYRRHRTVVVSVPYIVLALLHAAALSNRS